MNSRELNRAWLRISAFGDGPRGEFLDNLAGLVDAGIPVYDALDEMARAFGKAKDGRAVILREMARQLQHGRGLADAMRPWLASHEAMILDASGRGVELGAALRNAAALTEQRRRIIGAVTGAMGYPVVLLAVGAAMLVVFSTQVIPTLTGLIHADQWTGLGAFYRNLSLLVTGHGLLLAAAVIAALGAAFASLPWWRAGRVRAWLDRRLPPWNLYQVYQGAILLISISIMMRSGIAMADAVEILWTNHRSPWLRGHLAGIRRKLETGAGIRLAALDSPVFPMDIRVAVALFDRHSEPDRAMARLGQQAGESAQKSARRIGVLANAAVLFLVGGLVGGVIPAVMEVVMQFYTKASTSMRM